MSAFAPESPEQYGEGMDDEQLAEAGWAVGLDVWEPATKAFERYVDDGTQANSQLWSLREAIRAEHLEELRAAGRLA